MSERALERMLLLDSLRSALERDEFEIVYLPVLHKDQPPSLEALLRWRHPKLGLVAPASFIAQAEESGLMLPIGAGVLRGATRFAPRSRSKRRARGRQPVGAPVPAAEARRQRARGARGELARSLAAGARPHRGGRDDRGRGGHRSPAPAAPARRAARARRLRDRLLLDPPHPRRSASAAQDRPLADHRAAGERRAGGAGGGDPRRSAAASASRWWRRASRPRRSARSSSRRAARGSRATC